MRKLITFFIPGVPVPQGRPRTFVNPQTGRPVIYDPKKSRDWKSHVAYIARKYWTGELLTGPLEVSLVFHMPRPKSLPKRVKYHVKRPDLDNLTKAAKDGMKGIIYRDDSQVVLMSLGKRYGNKIGVSVMIRECEEENYIFYDNVEFGWIDFASGGVNGRENNNQLHSTREASPGAPEEDQTAGTPGLGSPVRAHQYRQGSEHQELDKGKVKSEI